MKQQPRFANYNSAIIIENIRRAIRQKITLEPLLAMSGDEMISRGRWRGHTPATFNPLEPHVGPLLCRVLFGTASARGRGEVKYEEVAAI